MNQLSEQLKDVVQPLIAIIFSVTACAAFLIKILPTDQWYSLAVAVISFYFGAKIATNAARRAPARATDIQNVEGNVNVQPIQPKPTNKKE